MSDTPAAATPFAHRVLVVDDTQTNRLILAVFFRKFGYVVDLAEDGAKAVEMFTANSYDLVIMDVMMPVMDGYEATRRIKALCGDRWVPVVFLSALDKDENLVNGLEAGGDDYLSKPVNFVVLEAKLRSLSRAITLRRELEDARRFNQAVTDNLLDAVITMDEQGTIKTVNPATTHIFGYPAADMIGRNVKMLMPEPYHTAHDGYLSRYVGGGVPRIIGSSGIEVTGLRRDGELIDISLSVSEFRDKGQRMFVGALRDISMQKEAERQLRDNATMLQAYHDEREAENALATEVFAQSMRRPGLSDPSLHYWMTSASSFSGDIVAAARASDGRLYALLADATGHGLGAAVSVVPVLTLFYDVVDAGLPLGRIIAKINNQLRGALPTGRFVACACLCIDQLKGHCELWMGGMPNALLVDVQGNVVSEIASKHLPLGIDEFHWRNATADQLSLPGGGQLVLYSDGLIEARDADEEEFGLDRLRAALSGAPADKRMDAVKDAVYAHLGTQSPHDDVTLMLVDLPPSVSS